MENNHEAHQHTRSRPGDLARLGASPEVVLEARLNPPERLPRRTSAEDGIPAERTLKRLVEDYERHVILTALGLSGWSQRRVAASLGLLPSTLSEKMKRLGLRPARAHTTVSNPALPLGRYESSSDA